MKKIIIVLFIMVMLVGCEGKIINNSETTKCSENEIYNTETESCELLTDNELDNLFISQYKVDISSAVVQKLKSIAYAEVAYFDDDNFVFVYKEELYVYSADGTYEVFNDLSYINEMSSNRTIGYNKATGDLIYFTYNSIKTYSTTTNESTSIISGQDGAYFDHTGGVGLYGGEAIIFDNLGNELRTIKYDENIYIQNNNILLYENNASTCSLYNVIGSTINFEIEIEGTCSKFIYVEDDLVLLESVTDLGINLVSISKDGTFEEIYTANQDYDTYISLTHKVLRITQGLTTSTYDMHLNSIDGSLYGSTEIYDADDMYIYGYDYNYGFVKANISSYEDYFQYTNPDYNVLDVQNGFVFFFVTHNSRTLGEVYNPENELVLQSVHNFTVINDNEAIYFKKSLEDFQGYIYNINDNTSSKIEGMVGQSPYFNIVNGNIHYHISSVYTYSTPGFPTEFQGEGKLFILNIDSLDSILLTHLTIKSEALWEDDDGNIYQFD